MADPDLAEFVLARLAETEATADHYHRLLCLRTACDADGCIWGEDEQEAMERERVCTCGYPEVIRAEVAAKRRIVENQQMYVSGQPGYGAATFAVKCLALSYTSHPAYQETWRS